MLRASSTATVSARVTVVLSAQRSARLSVVSVPALTTRPLVPLRLATGCPVTVCFLILIMIVLF